MPRVFGITRVSTEEQDLAPQRDEIERACQMFGLGSPVILDEPEGTSGRKTTFRQRPMGRYLLHTLKPGDTLVVTKVDRLGRSLIDLRWVMEFMSKKQVRTIILAAFGGRALDMDNTTDKLILSVLSLLAEWEAEIISQRTKEGLGYRKRNGMQYGRVPRFRTVEIVNGCKMLGWDFKLLDQVFELLELKAAGKSVQWLLWHCEEKNWVDVQGKRWWYCAKKYNSDGAHNVHRYLLAIRRLATAGELPPEYLARWPKALGPAGEPKKRKPR